MNFIFFGTPEFAAIVLQKLIDGGLAPSAVVCNPDRPVGRKKIIAPPPVKRLIANSKWQIAVLQPEKLSSFLFPLSSFAADFAVVASYAKIIPKEIIDLFPRGMIGVHPSLLPKYRGPSPIQSAILAGEEETGVTLYVLDEKVDHGPTIANAKLKMQNVKFTYIELMQKLAELGGDLLVETLPKFLAGEIRPMSQDETLATYTKKFTMEDAFIPLEDIEKALTGNSNVAAIIDRKIRALNPEPGVWTFAEIKAGGVAPGGDRKMKLLEAGVDNGRFKLKKVQLEGEKPRPIA